MNKMLFLIFISISIILITLKPETALAKNDAKSTHVSIGAVTWYAWWVPSMLKQATTGQTREKMGSLSRGPVLHSSFSMNNSSFLYGPVISIKVNDKWSISGVFAFCLHKGFSSNSYYYKYTGWTESIPIIGFTGFYSIIDVDKVDRYDADLTFNYRINKIFKFFFGCKYQGYEYKGNFLLLFTSAFSGLIPTFPIKLDTISKLHSSGLGAGFGMNFHLGNSFFFLYNLSIIFLGGNLESRNFDKSNDLFISYGFNTNQSFAYYIEKIKTTISFGYRFQFNRIHAIENTYEEENDLFHGVLLSVIYTF